jgi:hypothetical protein
VTAAQRPLERGCHTKRDDLVVPRHCKPVELADRRRYRLRTGIDRWLRDIASDCVDPHRVHLVALTVHSLDTRVAEGAMRRLYAELRALRGAETFRYFWWAEFQKRGAIHFHAIWVDAPFRTNREGRLWLRQHWPHGRIWPDVRKRDLDWFRAKAGGYVAQYAKKDGPKRYQQSFELMPKGWHVFASQRLAFPIAEHVKHEHQADLACTAPKTAPFYRRLAEMWVVGMLWHVPAPGGCRLDSSLRRKGRLTRAVPAAGEPNGDPRLCRKRSVTRFGRSAFGSSVPPPVKAPNHYIRRQARGSPTSSPDDAGQASALAQSSRRTEAHSGREALAWRLLAG